MNRILLALTLLPVWLMFTAQSCKNDAGKLIGKVEFKGVPCQPGQPDFNVPPCSGPYPNYEIEIFHASKLDQPVLRLKSGQDGTFQTQLPAGDFVIFTQNGPFEKNRKENKFTVKAKETTQVNLLINTGIL